VIRKRDRCRKITTNALSLIIVRIFRPFRGNDMKKTFALAAVLALGVVACSPAAEEAADTAADETAVAEDAMAAEAAPAEGDAMAAEAAPAEGDAMAAEAAPAAEATPAE